MDEVSNLGTLRRLLRSARPSVLLLDFSMPRLAGASGVAGIIRVSPSTRVVVLSDDSQDAQAVAVLKAGAQGCCGRELEAPMIRKMLEAIQKGELWVRRGVMLALLREVIPTRPDPLRDLPSDSRLRPLTPREREIAYLVGAGAKNKDIAASLNITETTVKAHLTAIFRKLGIPDRLRLALMITEGDRLELSHFGRS